MSYTTVWDFRSHDRLRARSHGGFAGLAQVKPPADMTFDKGKDSPGTVTFSHEKHVAAGNKCTSCHVKVFKMKKGQTGP